nr:DegV family protein [Anaerolineae bacterium]
MIRIVTDSDANMPQAVLDDYNIPFAPIQIIFGDEVLNERVDLTDEEAYDRITSSPTFPTTSQPSVGAFKTIFDQILAETPDATILSVNISGAMSGTVESARQAAALLPDADIHIFDTLSASLGQGLMVRQAADMARNGQPLEEILKTLEIMRDNMKVLFVLNTLDYLARGGRIGKASHLMGTLLDFKPILTLENGVIGAHSRQRTWGKAVASLKELVAAMTPEGDGPVHMGIVHALSETKALELMKDLESSLHPEVLMFGSVGPGLGVHTGPGALGVCWVRMPG